MKPKFSVQPNTANRKLKTVSRAILLGLWLAVVMLPSPARSQETLESQGISFRLVPGGTYLLGSPASEAGRYVDEALPHPVRLTPFYIGVTEITNAQYASFIRATGHRPPLYGHDRNLNGPNQPVTGVTWDDAAAFCRWLTKVTAVPHSLPREDQWEAAARGGLSGQPYPWGAAEPDAEGVYRANYRTNTPGAAGFAFTAPVGSFPANGFGLLDMAGNVAEWCLDQYKPGVASGPFTPGFLRLLKGGSWISRARDLRVAARQSAAPGYADGYIGFRVVRLRTDGN
jgi:formylglycine-generating enzyme required for sulfatase activity